MEALQTNFKPIDMSSRVEIHAKYLRPPERKAPVHVRITILDLKGIRVAEVRRPPMGMTSSGASRLLCPRTFPSF